MISDGTNDDTSNSPEHLQHLGSRGSQLYRHDLTTVCWRVGNEDTPWQALEKLGHENNWKRFGEVKYENEGVQEHETSQGRVAVSDTAGEGTCDDDADKGTELSRHLKGRLPLSHDDVFLFLLVPYTVFCRERRQGDEIADEEDIVGLHNLKVMLAIMPWRKYKSVKGNGSLQ